MTLPAEWLYMIPPSLSAALAAGGIGVAAIGLAAALSSVITRTRITQRLLASAEAVRQTQVHAAREWLRVWAERAGPKLEEAGWSLSPLVYLGALAVGALAAFTLGVGVLNNPIAGAALGAVTVLLPDELLTRAASAKRARLIRQLPATIQIFYAEFADGYNVRQALQATANRLPQPMRSVIQRTARQLQSGVPADEAFAALADALPTEYGRLFAQLLRSAHDDAGTGKMFPKLASRAVNHQTLTEKARSMVAWQSTVALILNALILPAFAVMQLIVPETFLYLTSTAMGKVAVASVALSLLTGVLLQRALRAGEVT